MPSHKEPIKKQSSYDEYAEDIKQLEDHMDKAMERALKEFKRLYGQRADKIGYVASGRGFVRRPGISNAFRDVASAILLPMGCQRTQREILNEVQAKYPDFKLYDNIWHTPLLSWQRQKLETLMRGMMAVPISIKKCKTLSDVKKLLKAQQGTKEAEVKATVQIAIHKSQVVIGKTVYPIQNRTVGGYSYPSIRIGKGAKRQWVRVDLLRESLIAS